jgi:hypothetical protein
MTILVEHWVFRARAWSFERSVTMTVFVIAEQSPAANQILREPLSERHAIH